VEFDTPVPSRRALSARTAEALVLFITFVLTLFADLTFAVESGMVLAAVLYIRRVTTTTIAPRYAGVHH